MARPIPLTRDNALYQAVENLLKTTKHPLTAAQVRANSKVSQLVEGKRKGVVHDCLKCLTDRSAIQKGYTPDGVMVFTSLDQPSPGAKENPMTSAQTKGGAGKPRKQGFLSKGIYEATKLVLDAADGGLTIDELKLHKLIAPHLVGQRATKINEILNQLKAVKKIQFGFNDERYIVVAALGKPFPYKKVLPKGQGVRFRVVTPEAIEKVARQAKREATQEANRIAHETEAPPQPEAEPIQAAPIQQPAPPTPIAFSLDGLVHQLAHTLGSQFGAMLAESFTKSFIETATKNLPPQFASALAVPVPVQPEKVELYRPKVIVAGLLPQQAGLIVQEFGERLNLSFVESKEVSNSKRVHALVTSHDAAFAMTGFINHSLYNMLRGTKEFRHVKGGMTTLREELNAYLGRQMPPPAVDGHQQQGMHH